MRASSKHRVLPGLPGEGNYPRQFSATGLGTHREGYVVELLPETDDAWVGNFQPGATQLSDVLLNEPRHEALVIAGGQGYLVGLSTGALLAEVGGFIDLVCELADGRGFILASTTELELFRDGQIVWSTRRLSWDGFRGVVVQGDLLSGEAWMYDDTWHPFAVKISTGEASGGSYGAV